MRQAAKLRQFALTPAARLACDPATRQRKPIHFLWFKLERGPPDLPGTSLGFMRDR
jgi:hypothetical protein